jgi:hypothetical protein
MVPLSSLSFLSYRSSVHQHNSFVSLSSLTHLLGSDPPPSIMPQQILNITPGTSTTPIANQLLLECHFFLPGSKMHAVNAVLTYTNNNLAFLECTSLDDHIAGHEGVSPVTLESLCEVIAFGKTHPPPPPPPPPPLHPSGDAASFLNCALASPSSSRPVDPRFLFLCPFLALGSISFFVCWPRVRTTVDHIFACAVSLTYV